MSITDEASATIMTSNYQCESQFASVKGYLREVGAKTVLRHIVKTDPDIVLNLPMVVRARTVYAKTKVEITQDRARRTHDNLRRKSVHLKSQLTKSLKRQSKVEGLASAARTRLTTAKVKHMSQVNHLEQSKKKIISKYKSQHMQYTTLVEGLKSSMRELKKDIRSRDVQLKAKTRVLRDENLLVEDLQEQLQELKQSCIASEAAKLFPRIKRLQRRVEKLRSQSKIWEQKRADVRDAFKRIRDRAALGYKKKQLLTMIKDLRLQLNVKRDNVKLRRMRHQLQVLFI